MKYVFSLLLISGSAAAAGDLPGVDSHLLAYRAAIHRRHIPTEVIWRGPVAPKQMLVYEIILNYLEHHPHRRAAIEPRVADFVACNDRMHHPWQYPTVGDRIEGNARCEALWQSLLGEMTAPPWSSLDWGLVFGAQLAGLEFAASGRMGFAPPRYFALFDQALLTSGGLRALIGALADPDPHAPAVDYAMTNLETVIKDVEVISPALAAHLATVNRGPVDPRIVRDELLGAAGVRSLADRQGSLLKFDFVRFLAKSDGRDVFVAAPEYVRAYRTIKRIQDRAERLGESPAKDVIVGVAGELAWALAFELKTLPGRVRVAAEARRQGWSWADERWSTVPAFLSHDADAAARWASATAEVESPPNPDWWTCNAELDH